MSEETPAGVIPTSMSVRAGTSDQMEVQIVEQVPPKDSVDQVIQEINTITERSTSEKSNTSLATKMQNTRLLDKQPKLPTVVEKVKSSQPRSSPKRKPSGELENDPKKKRGHERSPDDRIVRVYAWMTTDQVEAEGIFRAISNDYFQNEIRNMKPEDARLRLRVNVPVWDRVDKCLKLFAHAEADPGIIANDFNEQHKLTAFTQKEMKVWTKLFVSLNKFAISSGKGPLEAYEYLRYNLEKINFVSRTDWRMLSFKQVGAEEYYPDNEGYMRASRLGGSYAIIAMRNVLWESLQIKEMDFIDGTVRFKPVETPEEIKRRNRNRDRGNPNTVHKESTNSREPPVSGANAIATSVRPLAPPKTTLMNSALQEEPVAKQTDGKTVWTATIKFPSHVQKRIKDGVYKSPALSVWAEWDATLEERTDREDLLMKRVLQNTVTNEETKSVYSLASTSASTVANFGEEGADFPLEEGELPDGLSEEEKLKRIRTLKRVRSRAKGQLAKMMKKDIKEVDTIKSLVSMELNRLRGSEKEVSKYLKDDLVYVQIQMKNRGETLARRMSTFFPGEVPTTN
jgi:hypothetical protein